MFFKTKIKQGFETDSWSSFTKDFEKILNNLSKLKQKTGIIYDAGLQIYMRKFLTS
jgi:hypothetical protein